MGPIQQKLVKRGPRKKMEELQDAIEDAQYINAMQDDTPKPTKPWKIPAAEEMQKYMTKVRIASPRALEPGYICTGSLGFYMFMRFVKNSGAPLMAHFIEEVAEFRTKLSLNLAIKANRIRELYLDQGSSGDKFPAENPRRCDLVRLLPNQQNVQQNQLRANRPSASESITSQSMNMSSYTSYDPRGSAVSSNNSSDGPSVVGGGQVLREVIAAAGSAGGGGGGAGEGAAGAKRVSVRGDGDDDGDGKEESIEDRRIREPSGASVISSSTVVPQIAVPQDAVRSPTNRFSSSSNYNNNKNEFSSLESPQNHSQLENGGISKEDIHLSSLSSSNSRGSKSPSVEMRRSHGLWEGTVRLDTAKNAIRCQGPVVDKILQTLQEELEYHLARGIAASNDKNKNNNNNSNNSNNNGSAQSSPQRGTRRTTGSSAAAGDAPALKQFYTTSLFDELDEVVFSYVVDTYFDRFKQSPDFAKYNQYMCMADQPVTEEDFSLFRVLGRGGFGMVNGCKRCYSGKLFAMKIMNKKRVKMKKAEALCMNERNILASVDSPFIVCLKYAFTTPHDLYLILDLMIGGDLGYHLQRVGMFAPKDAKFFAARILLGIAALHEQSIVYRDLKPENVLMDELGYTKISDLGLACRVGRSGLSGTCGTRGYWAPEMLRRDANGKRERYYLSVDWFSFGCCVYEFLYGISPFRTERARCWGHTSRPMDKDEKNKAIDRAILEMEPEFPDNADAVSRDFLLRLLHKDGRVRLGSRGFKEIIAHPWFADVDFDNLNTVTPPIKPAKDINMATQSEIGSFSDEKLSKKIVLTDADQKQYESWQFLSVRAYQEEVVQFLCYEEVMGPIRPVTYGQSCCCCIQ